MAQAQQATSPPKLFILPIDTSIEARIVTLPNPRTSHPSRYFFCPERGLYEFTKIAAPKSAPRSLLLSRPVLLDATTKGTEGHDDAGAQPTSETKQNQDGGDPIDVSKGYVFQTADLFIATPMDPLFIVLPALAATPTTTSKRADERSKKQLFLSVDDHLDNLVSSSSSSSTHVSSRILRTPACRRLFEHRMQAVCDCVEAGDERMYRLNEEKLVQEIMRKAQNVVAAGAGGGLPASLEEKFVTRALEVPWASIRREESSASNVAVEQEEEVTPSYADATITTTTAATSDTSSLSTSTSQTTTTSTTCTTTAPTSPTPSESITHLLRLRTALTYLSTNYLPRHLCNTVLTTTVLSSPDFAPLNAHLAQLRLLRESAINARSLADFSRKHALEEEEDGDVEKRRKKEEEEKMKRSAGRGSSRALRDLNKVDVTGMKKLSAFFGAGGDGGKKKIGGVKK